MSYRVLTVCHILQLINICSNDGQRMFEAAAVGSLLAGGPVVAILGMIYNVIILGPTGFLGSAVFILFYPAMVSEPLSAASWSLLHRGQSACAELQKAHPLGLFSKKEPYGKSLVLGSAAFIWAGFGLEGKWLSST